MLRANSNLGMSVDGGIMKGRVILIALYVDIGPSSEKLSGHIRVAVIARLV